MTMRVSVVTALIGVGAELMMPAIWSLGIYAFGVSVALYRVWVSTGRRNLNLLNEAITKANIVVGYQNAEVIRLTNDNEVLKTIQRTQQADLREVRGKYAELMASHERIAKDYADVKKDLKAERELRDDQFMQLTQALAKLDKQHSGGN